MRELLARRIDIKSENKAMKLYKYIVANPSQSKHIRHVHFTFDNAVLPLIVTELLPIVITPNIRKLTGSVKSDIFFTTLFSIIDKAPLDKLTTLPIYNGYNSGLNLERILKLKSSTVSLKITLYNFSSGTLWNFVRQLDQFPKLTTLNIKGYVRNFIELETALKRCSHLVTLTIYDFEFKELPKKGMQIRDFGVWLKCNVKKELSLKTLKVESTCCPEFVEYLTYKYPNITSLSFDGKLWHPDGSIAINNGNLDRVLNAVATIPSKHFNFIIPSQTRMKDAFRFCKSRLEDIQYSLKEYQGKDELVITLEENQQFPPFFFALSYIE